MARKQHPNRIYQVIGEPPLGTHGVGYARYSSDMQNPASLVTQERRIEEFFERKQWILDRFWEEPEQSAKYEEIEQRPVFAQMLAEAGTTFHVIVCYMNDRWARNMNVAFNSLSILRRKKVWWATADGNFDLDSISQDGRDVSFVVDTQINAAFVRKLSKREIDALEDRGRAGYHNGKPLFGYLMPQYEKAPDGAPSTWRPPRQPARVDPENFPGLIQLGEFVAQGWTDQAIADELSGYLTDSPRFGRRPLSKDTVATIRRSWFPREFKPSGWYGTVETPSGQLIEGRHLAAWSTELWQRMEEVKKGQYRRPTKEAQRRPHAFSRIVVCASCKRPLRVTTSQGIAYYKDSSQVRRLPCGAYGCLSVKETLLLEQFGALLASVTLPAEWRDAVAQKCQTSGVDPILTKSLARRVELEAEQERLVNAYTKGFLTEEKLDTQVGRIRAELQTLPKPQPRDTNKATKAALAAGETLADMAAYWGEATPEEQRDMVGALLSLGGLIYDLEQQGIVGLFPRPDTLPVLALGLSDEWEQRDDGFWLREDVGAFVRRGGLGAGPHTRSSTLTTAQQEDALAQVRSGRSPQQVAKELGVSYWRILRLLKRHDPTRLPAQQQPKLSPEQQQEARQMLEQGMRQVGKHFQVSYSAIWRLTQREQQADASQGGQCAKREKKGGEGER
jgi:DNA invertase Pin-like site-specific DNA recombinase